MTKKVSVKDLRKHLEAKSDKALREEIIMLYKRFSMVKDYYTSSINPADSFEVLSTYKEKITKEFFPKRGYGTPKLSAIRKVINDYKKVAPTSQHAIDLMLHCVEQGSAFTDEFGDMYESYYESLENTFEAALKLMVAENSVEFFDDRCRKIVSRAFQGWGFADMLDQHYDTYISERNT